ncbi:MAG: hypothetical protein BAJALOKI2v1_520010 [Promethearchaeota archaeon]|nr:MAG: hypothetical protein BAJALOKI2v1_520010 [Candidatus Lokiarchaeota archaeon]
MYSIYFLFTELLSKERMNWVKDSLYKFNHETLRETKKQEMPSESYHLAMFLTGEAIYNLIDQQYSKLIEDVLLNYEASVIIDPNELELYGFEYNDLVRNFKNKSSLLESKIRIIKKENFWTYLINNIKIRNKKNRIGFFQFEGPYMSRTSVYATRFIESAIESKLNVDLYTYLDGIHIGHTHQRPSEFENIAEKLIELKSTAAEKDLDFNMFSCSRCATARGYIKTPPKDEFIQSKDAIKDYLFCNLNKIVDKFEDDCVIMSPNSASIQFNDLRTQNTSYDKPKNIVLMTRPPYNSEWSFGGISFAMASAAHEISTRVLFLENGIYNIVGNHKVDETKKLFNLQEVIAATADMEHLEYFVYNPSLKMRRLSVHNDIKEHVKNIKKYEIGNILFKTNKNKSKHQNRIIIF